MLLNGLAMLSSDKSQTLYVLAQAQGKAWG
jgi:hypothetical protein